MTQSYITIGLHDGHFEVEVLVSNMSGSEEEIKKIGNSSHFNIGFIHPDKIDFKNCNLVIKKEEIEKYQFRICRQWKPIVSSEDYENISWNEAIDYIRNKEQSSLPFLVESYFYQVYSSSPFKEYESSCR